MSPRAFTGWTVETAARDRRLRVPPRDARRRREDRPRPQAPGRPRRSRMASGARHRRARIPATAHFIATKLVRRFVSDSVPPALVDRVAATFARTDGDIRECLRTIFTSPEFFSRAAYKAKVKSPFELVVSALRAVGAAARQHAAHGAADRAGSASRCTGTWRRTDIRSAAMRGSTPARSSRASTSASWWRRVVCPARRRPNGRMGRRSPHSRTTRRWMASSARFSAARHRRTRARCSRAA